MATNASTLSRLWFAIAAVLLLLLSTCNSQQIQTDDLGPNAASLSPLLRSNHFQVTATARIIGNESIRVDHEVTISEFYSNQLGRARLELQSRSWAEEDPDESATDGAKTYYYSEESDKFLRSSASKQSACELVSASNLVNDLVGSKASSESRELNNWLSLFPSNVPKYALGFGKLLLLVELNRARLKPSRRPRGVVLIRNQEVEGWELDFPMPAELAKGDDNKEKLTLKLYMLKTTDLSHEMGVPLRIWFQTPNGAELIVDYSLAGPMKELPARLLAHEQSLLSFFSFPVGWACSQLLKPIRDPKERLRVPSKQESHMRDLQERRIVSFEAELSGPTVGDRGSLNERLFVAFDGFSNAFRLDRMNSRFGHHTITIEDILFQQKYHISYVKSSAPKGQESGAMFRELASGQWECYASKTGLKISERLFQFTEFVHMGSAMVRGINTMAFEEVSEELPKLIFPRVNYVDYTNASRLASAPKLSGFAEEDAAHYSIVYYFSWADTPTAELKSLEQLLRIDVHSRGRLIYRADVFNFKWTLTEAPNGDRQDLLFSLQDRCKQFMQTPPPREQAAKMLLLELSYVETPTLYNAPASRILRMVQSAPIRNRAIIRGLSSVANSIYASQIMSINSRIHQETNMRAGTNESKARGAVKILASFELAHSSGPLQPQFEAVGVAKGRQRSVQAGTKAYTFDQCFWHAAQQLAKSQLAPNGPPNASPKLVLFSFCQTRCIIDVAATKADSSNSTSKYDSNAFYVSDKLDTELCEILEMRAQKSPGSGQAEDDRFKSWSDLYSILNEKLLTLRLNDEDENKVAVINELYFMVSRIQLNPLSQDSSALLEDSLAGNHEGLFQGLALIPNEQLGSRVLELDSQSDGDSRVPLASSADSCHSQCVADLGCKSFSTCVLDEKLQCVVSELDLGREEVVEALRGEVGRFRASHKGQAARGTIRVHGRVSGEVGAHKVGEPDEQIADEPSKASEIEFRVDNRCQTRVKRAIELFKQQTTKSSSKLFESALVGVQNVEECAQMCLKKNVNFYKRLGRLQVELEAGEMKPLEVYTNLTDSMRYWCSSFKYANLRTRSVPYDILSRIKKTSKLASAPALCYMARPKWAPKNLEAGDGAAQAAKKSEDGALRGVLKRTEEKAKVVTLKMDNFEFLYTNLYKRQSDLHLLGSESNNLGAVPSASDDDARKEVRPETLALNLQTMDVQWEVEKCARTCFSQVVQWCRSFDFIQINHSGERLNFCVYNSLTLEDASRLDSNLITSSRRVLHASDNNGTSYKASHYEPQKAYRIDNVVFKFLDESHGRERRGNEGEGISGRAENRSGYFPVSILLICTAGLASGLLVAQQFARRRDQNQQLSQRLVRAQGSLNLAADVEMLEHEQVANAQARRPHHGSDGL